MPRAKTAEATYEWGLERFLDEARALATFRHPNIVRVLRYFRSNGTAYIVMEYETGVSLKRWVPQHAPLSKQGVLAIVLPLLDGLEQVHSGEFLHRDIKPDNIYVRANNTPVLLDFGSAPPRVGEPGPHQHRKPRLRAVRAVPLARKPGTLERHLFPGRGDVLDGDGQEAHGVGFARQDGRHAARQQASRTPSVYGHEMLGAIDWALQPDESKRPQSVSALRRILLPDDLTRPARKPGDAQGAPPVDAQAMTAAAHAPSQPGVSDSNPSLKRTLLGTILFLDLVGYTGRSVTDQVAIKKLFNELIAKALKGVPEDTRIAIDTGDGAAICFLGDPEEALQSALLLRDLLGQRYGAMLSVRIGLHLGPVRVIADINDRINVVGDGINVAARVMDFAQGNQVLVSRAYYDVLSRITDDTAGMFRSLGGYEDKHGRVHEVYAVDGPQRGGAGNTHREGPSTGYTQTLPVKNAFSLSPEAAQDLEAELARHIGPLAKVMVRKAQLQAGSLAELREALGALIPEAGARESFLAGSDSRSHPLSRPRSTSGAPSGAPATHSGPSSRSVPLEPSGGSGRSGNTGLSRPSGPTHRLGSSSATVRQLDLSPDEVTAVEQALSKFIGPMARMLVKREMVRHTNLSEFAAAVAQHVDPPAQREPFQQALKKALPKRSF